MKFFNILAVGIAAVSAHTIPLDARATGGKAIKICTQRQLPSELQALADKLAIKENPANGHALPPGSMGAALALPTGKMWATGRTLRVKILNGTPKVKAKIQEYASQWTQWANIKLQWVTSGDAEIRVNVDSSGGSWSYVGTENLGIPQSNQTMNFGWFTDSTDEQEFSRVIIHEFGHALGCNHEHQSPAASGIPWNKPAVYEYYRITNKWTKEQVDSNIFALTSESTTQFTAFDESSIMLYSIPAELTTNGYSVGWNSVLSVTDKTFIGQVYPFEAAPNVNSFNTMEIRPADQPRKLHTKRFSWTTSYSQPPSIALGLNWLDIGRSTNPRIKTYQQDTTTTKTDIHIDTWGDTTLYSAGVSWFRHAANDADIQSGSWSTTEDHPFEFPQTKTQKQIVFPRAYSAPPKVIVWLTQIDVRNNANFRVRALISDVTATGFKLNLDTWADSTLYQASASWVAHSAGKAGITSGSFSTDDVRPWDKPSLVTSGTTAFPAGTFTKAPNVVVGLTTIDVDKSTNPRVKAVASAITKDGMTWNLDAWADTTLYRAAASYIAYA
ncbi:hypothetical protein QBC42DRAFT_288797 [Cladorrhinum samala]|uniref:Peptidase metallopeptidase domain-containing protein n=1 Tax=Cladorrhinum samala TaxID=585594 RepID=A0AAV9HHJ6_9PEZI|nr:hypothetical protein QBC42DRAFT_288797 [Cladorrhinum samala]